MYLFWLRCYSWLFLEILHVSRIDGVSHHIFDLREAFETEAAIVIISLSVASLAQAVGAQASLDRAALVSTPVTSTYHGNQRS